MFTIRYMKCGRKWQVVAHEGGRKLGVLSSSQASSGVAGMVLEFSPSLCNVHYVIDLQTHTLVFLPAFLCMFLSIPFFHSEHNRPATGE